MPSRGTSHKGLSAVTRGLLDIQNYAREFRSMSGSHLWRRSEASHCRTQKMRSPRAQCVNYRATCVRRLAETVLTDNQRIRPILYIKPIFCIQQLAMHFRQYATSSNKFISRGGIFFSPIFADVMCFRFRNCKFKLQLAVVSCCRVCPLGGAEVGHASSASRRIPPVLFSITG